MRRNAEASCSIIVAACCRCDLPKDLTSRSSVRKPSSDISESSECSPVPLPCWRPVLLLGVDLPSRASSPMSLMNLPIAFRMICPSASANNCWHIDRTELRVRRSDARSISKSGRDIQRRPTMLSPCVQRSCTVTTPALSDFAIGLSDTLAVMITSSWFRRSSAGVSVLMPFCSTDTETLQCPGLACRRTPVMVRSPRWRTASYRSNSGPKPLSEVEGGKYCSVSTPTLRVRRSVTSWFARSACSRSTTASRFPASSANAGRSHAASVRLALPVTTQLVAGLLKMATFPCRVRCPLP